MMPGRRALLVEDDADMRALATCLLRHEGYEVFEAAAGIDLLEWIARTTSDPWDHFFDVIVSDVNMPDLTALEVLAALRCRKSRVPVILITAFADADLRREARALGAYACLEKPLDLDEFHATLQMLTAGRGIGRDAPDDRTPTS